MEFILQVDKKILSSTCTFVEYSSGELQWNDEIGLHSETSYGVLYYNNQDIKEGQTWEGPDDVLLTTAKKPEEPTNPPTENEEPSVPEPGGENQPKYNCIIQYFKDNIEDEDERKKIEYYWITRPSELPEFIYATEHNDNTNKWVEESLYIYNIGGFELDRIDTVIDSNYWEQDTVIKVYYKTKQEDPVVPSSGKIATNEDIYNASKYIYGVNNNQCPTKEFIVSNGYDIVKFNNDYQVNQCVVLEDLSFERVFDNIVVKNNCGVALDAFGIYFSYNEPSSNNVYDFLSYEFADDYIDKNFDGIIPTKKLYSSNIGDYRNKKLYLGFWSKNWESSKRKFTFKINEKTFTTNEASSDYVKSDIDVIDFLRHYYNKITIVINKN